MSSTWITRFRDPLYSVQTNCVKGKLSKTSACKISWNLDTRRSYYIRKRVAYGL